MSKEGVWSKYLLPLIISIIAGYIVKTGCSFMKEKEINSFITFDITKEDGLLILFIFLCWLSVAWTVKTVGRNRKWLLEQWKKIIETEEAKREKEEKKQQEIKEKRQNKWQNLITEAGYHYGLSTDRSRGICYWSEEDYEKNRQFIIRNLKDFSFSLPNEADMLEDDFDEKWLEFLKGLREIIRLHPIKPPREKKFLTLWNKIKSKNRNES